jgi:Pvc16 N-terminal domain
MEPESVDEIGRLWQAISSPLRLSAVYRASVIFLEPEPETPRIVPVVSAPHVSAYPEFAITRAVVDVNRLATITGNGFVGGSIVVRVDNVKMGLATALAHGDNTFRVDSATTLVIQLPSGTPDGRHRLGIQLAPGQEEALFTLEVPPP